MSTRCTVWCGDGSRAHVYYEIIDTHKADRVPLYVAIDSGGLSAEIQLPPDALDAIVAFVAKQKAEAAP